jgi:predicted transcriptional regulator
MRSNYLTIQGWMIADLNLSGNQLLAYALIYGFTQDGDSEFSGSVAYISKWLNCSKPTTLKAINDLVEKGLILKYKFAVNGVCFNKYKAVYPDSKESLLPVKKNDESSKESLSEVVKNLDEGSKESLPNNIINNNIINNTINNIEERKLKFADTLKPYLDLYGRELIKDFYLYWTEPNHSNKKMKYELEKTWSLERRLRTWIKNDKNFKNGKSNNTKKSMDERLAETIQRLNGTSSCEMPKQGFNDQSQFSIESVY